jgi:transposase
VTRAEAALAVGAHRRTVNVRRERYRERGEEGVLDGRRGSPRRGGGPLAGEEAGRAQARITGTAPDRQGLPWGLWTRRAARELVERRFGERLGLSAVPPHLKRWGLTPQKPLARAKERSPGAIRAWLERDCPAIAGRAEAERAAVRRGDETGLSNQGQAGRSRAPEGETPVVARTAERATRGMTAAVSNRGLMRFMLRERALDADRFLAFLRRLADDAGRKVPLTVDTPRVRHARKVEAWAAGHAHEIGLCCLPAYAPRHDPEEYLDNDPRQKLRRQPQPDTKEEPVERTRSVPRAIRRRPERVRARLTPEPVRYAAWMSGIASVD